MKKIIFLILLSFQLHTTGQQWEAVGNAFGTVANGAISDMLFQPETNDLYVAYPDATEKKYVVQKRVGDEWVQVGASFGKTDSTGITGIAMVVHPETNEIYVAYPDYTFYAFIVQKYNEETEAWEAIGSDLGNIDGIPGVDIAFQPQTNELHLIYPDPELDIFLVQKFNGNSWEGVGTGIGETNENARACIAFHPLTNEAYVGHTNNETLYITIHKYNGNTWEQQGEGIPAGFTEAQIDIEFHSTTGTPYIGFPHIGGDNYHAREFDGEEWPLMSYLGATSDYRTGFDLTFDSVKERLYAAYLVYNKIEVQYYDGTEWTTVGEQIANSGEYAGIVIQLNPSTNEPYLLFRDNESNQYIVYKYNTGLSIPEENDLLTQFYTNAERGDLHIELSAHHKTVMLEVINMQGQVIQKEQFRNSNTLHTQIQGSAGVYMLKVSVANQKPILLKMLKY